MSTQSELSSEHTDPSPPAGGLKRLLSMGSDPRFDNWIEFIAAAILALATIATAWCGYQAAKWSGDQQQLYTEATTLRIEASEKNAVAMQKATIEVGLFLDFARAKADGQEELADFLYERFPPTLRTATDAWIATNPLENPDAPPSPFAMSEYQLAEQAEARQLTAASAAKAQEADVANDTSDRYVLLTVLFAAVLFFGGISGKFQSRLIDLLMLATGILVFAGGTVILFTFPVR